MMAENSRTNCVPTGVAKTSCFNLVYCTSMTFGVRRQTKKCINFLLKFFVGIHLRALPLVVRWIGYKYDSNKDVINETVVPKKTRTPSVIKTRLFYSLLSL